MRYPLYLFLLVIPFFTNAQIIPAPQRVDWSKAGVEGDIPGFATVIDITNLGAIPNDSIDDSPAIDSAMRLLTGVSGVIYLPAGSYVVGSTIDIKDSIIIRGAGSDSTILHFMFGGAAAHSFHIGRGLTEAFHPMESGYSKDSRRMVVTGAPTFLTTGDNIEIREENGSWDIQPVSWADYAVGHFAKIDSLSADTVWLSEALRLDLDSALHPEIRKITPRIMCGFECFKMIREDANTNGISYGFDFANASNCWLRGIESERSICAHVSIDRSSHISVSGCYFHDSYLYDGASTRGYGVMLLSHAASNLIEDNVFKHLRHAMIAKQGANGNVFGYNYSLEPNRSEPIPDYAADLCLHGHYAFANLFEGNIAQNLQIDIVWGPSGPYNTFFRNRVGLYGILMSSGSMQSNGQNFVGNTVTSSGILQGNYSLNGTGHFQHGNNIKGTATPANTGTLADVSYYLDTVPPFFWNIQQALPAIGYPHILEAGNNPALQRYTDGGTITRCAYVAYADTTNTIDTTINTSVALLQSAILKINSCIHTGSQLLITLSADAETDATVELLSLTGQLVTKQPVFIGKGSSAISLPVSQPAAGMYLLQVTTRYARAVRKVVVE